MTVTAMGIPIWRSISTRSAFKVSTRSLIPSDQSCRIGKPYGHLGSGRNRIIEHLVDECRWIEGDEIFVFLPHPDKLYR